MKASHKRHNMISVYTNNKQLLFPKWDYNPGKYLRVVKKLCSVLQLT